MNINTAKLAELLASLEAMLAIQRPKPARYRAAIISSGLSLAPLGINGTILRSLESEIALLESVVRDLRGAGVRIPTDQDFVAPEPASGDYGASGEEVADIKRALESAQRQTYG